MLRRLRVIFYRSLVGGNIYQILNNSLSWAKVKQYKLESFKKYYGNGEIVLGYRKLLEIKDSIYAWVKINVSNDYLNMLY